MRLLGPSRLIMICAIGLLSFFAYLLISRQGTSFELTAVLILEGLVLYRLIRIGIWVYDDEVILRNAWKTERSPIEHVEMRAAMLDEDIGEIDHITGGHARTARAKAGDEGASRRLLRNRLIIDGEQHEIDAMLGRTREGQAEAAAKVIEALYAAKARRSPPPSTF